MRDRSDEEKSAVERSGSAVKVVDLLKCHTNRDFFPDIIHFVANPRKLSSQKIAETYLKTGMTAEQIAEDLGISTSTVVNRLNRQGIHGGDKSVEPKNYRRPNPPWGFKVKDHQLLPNEREVRIARTIVDLRRRAQLRWDDIAMIVNRKNYRTRRGAKWTADKVRKIWRHWKDKS